MCAASSAKYVTVPLASSSQDLITSRRISQPGVVGEFLRFASPGVGGQSGLGFLENLYLFDGKNRIRWGGGIGTIAEGIFNSEICE